MIEMDWHPGEKQLKQFGWISLFGFPLIGVLLWWKFDEPSGTTAVDSSTGGHRR